MPSSVGASPSWSAPPSRPRLAAGRARSRRRICQQSYHVTRHRQDEQPRRLDSIAQTQRLRLRRLQHTDAAFLLELLNQASWLEFIGDRNVHTEAQAREYLAQRIDAQFQQHGAGMWGIELRPAQRTTGLPNMHPSAVGQLVGVVGLVKRDYLPEPDLGFALLDRFAGQGLAYEAAAAVLPLAQARGLQRLLAITHPGNRRSISLLHRLGFQLEGLQPVPGSKDPVLRYSKALAP
jgi:[ribosomal protein S5]-alanine N-acetyltransferase